VSRAIQAVRLLAARWPRASYLAARLLAWLGQPLGRGVPAERLAELFPDLPPAAVRAARRRTWSTYVRGEALNAAVAVPERRPFYPRSRPHPAVDRLRPPLIIGAFHVGPYAALGVALRTLPGEVLVVHHGPAASRQDVSLLRVGDSEWERARGFHRSVTTLRSGGFVVTALDGYGGQYGYAGSTVEAPMFGGTATLARGPFALARITDTPIVLLVGRWRGNSVEVTCGEPLVPGDETTMAAAAAAWLEAYLREFPGEVSARTLEILRRG
jgi:hypothetical protein